MICEKYRNLKIIYDDHTCLEKETVLSTVKNLNKYFDRINDFFSEKEMGKAHYIHININKTHKLFIYAQKDLNHNPYLYIFDTENKTYSDLIDAKLFIQLGKDYVLYDLEDKLKFFLSPVYEEMYEVTKVKEILENNSKKYDNYDER